MKVKEIAGGTYEVASESGHTYTVKYCGSGDGDPDYCALWECNCPASKFRTGICKHIKAVIEFSDTDHRLPLMEA